MFFKLGLEDIAGTSLDTYLIESAQEMVRNEIKIGTGTPPSVLYDIRLKGIEDTPCMIRLYASPSVKYCLAIFESQQVNEEVLIAREERKWADRLQIMLFGISHELKTPLATARGYTEMLVGNDPEGPAREVFTALGRISAILNNMTEPIRELNEKQDRVDLGHSIELYGKTRPYIEPSKRYIGHFEADFSAAMGKIIRMSKTRFYQVLTNLFENSVRATEGQDTEACISINTRVCNKTHHHKCIVMEFTDNGCGMDEDTLQKVLTPYYTTRKQNTGTGLGGYFIYQFVMDAGGTVDVGSEVGQGTTFTLHFPYLD